MGQTEMVTLDRASLLQCQCSQMFPSGEERMAEREGWRGGEREKRRGGAEKGVGRDPVWRWCRHWPSVNGKVTEPLGASVFSHLQWE